MKITQSIAIDTKYAPAYDTNYITTDFMTKKQRQRIPNSIRRYRRKKSLRLYEVAHFARLASPANISHWEKGKITPTLESALKLSAILQCPIEVLFLEEFNRIRHDIHLRKQEPIKKPL